MTDRFDFDELIPADEVWARLDRFKIAYVDALIEAEEVEDASEFYGEGKSAAWHQVHMNVAFVVSGRPASLDPNPGHLTGAWSDLQTAKGFFDGLGAELTAWSGLAASEFKDKYQDRFGPVNADQYVMLAELTGFCLGYRQLMARARQDLVAMLDSAIEACESYEKDSGGGSAWNTVFKTLGMVAMAGGMVAAAMGSGGASLAATSTIAGGFLSFGETFTEPGTSPVGAGFAEPSEILSRLMTTSGALCDAMVAESDHLASLLKEDLDAVSPEGALVIDGPDVTELKPHEYIPMFPYNQVSETMTVDLYQLWRAGTRRLPLVAESYAAAATAVDACDGGVTDALGGAEFVGGGVAENLAYLFDVVQSRLGIMRDGLMAVGEAFVAIAEAYSSTDDNGADALDRHVRRELEYGNLDDVPTSVPPVEQPDLDSPPDAPVAGEGPPDYVPATIAVVGGSYNIGTGMPVTTYYEVSPDQVPHATQTDVYDANGEHGGNTPPPGVEIEEDDD